MLFARQVNSERISYNQEIKQQKNTIVETHPFSNIHLTQKNLKEKKKKAKKMINLIAFF